MMLFIINYFHTKWKFLIQVCAIFEYFCSIVPAKDIPSFAYFLSSASFCISVCSLFLNFFCFFYCDLGANANVSDSNLNILTVLQYVCCDIMQDFSSWLNFYFLNSHVCFFFLVVLSQHIRMCAYISCSVAAPPIENSNMNQGLSGYVL